MAKCEYHSRYGSRGRVPGWCNDCYDTNEAAKAAKAAKALERAAAGKATRQAGRTVIERLLVDQKNEATENYRKEVARVNEKFDDLLTTPEITNYKAELARITRELEMLMQPIETAREAELSRVRKELDRARQEARALFDLRQINLELRCHVWIGKSNGRACGKYLDYNGHCPTHGDIGAPGS